MAPIGHIPVRRHLFTHLRVGDVESFGIGQRLPRSGKDKGPSLDGPSNMLQINGEER